MIHPALFEQVNTELVRLKLLEDDAHIRSLHFDETDGHLESVFLESGLHALAKFYGVETTPYGAMSQCRIGDVAYCQPLTESGASDTKKWTEDMAVVYTHNEMNQICSLTAPGKRLTGYARRPNFQRVKFKPQSNAPYTPEAVIRR